MVQDRYVHDGEVVYMRTDIQALGGRNAPVPLEKIDAHLWRGVIELVRGIWHL